MNIDFKKLLTARFLVTMGLQMQAVILGWQMYVLSQNPLYLGLVGLTEALPAVGLALHAGLIVDRSKPLNVFRWVLIVSLLSAIVMLLSLTPLWQLSTQQKIIALFISSFLTGTARAFSQPSMFAIVPRIIPKEELHQSSAWMASTMQVARISGPALGGLLFGIIGAMWTSSIVVSLIGLSILCAFMIRVHIPGRGAISHESVRDALLSGLRFVTKHPILFPAMLLDMVSVLFGGVTALLPIFAAEILGTGAFGLGCLRASPAVGAALMSFWLTTADIRARAGTWFLTAVTGFGVCILVFSVSRSFTLSLIALALSGAFDSISMVIRTSAVQLASPDEMRGRISSVNSIFISSSNEIGEFESGVAARLLGTVNAAIFGGVVCLLAIPIVAWRYPALRRLDLNQLAPLPVDK